MEIIKLDNNNQENVIDEVIKTLEKGGVVVAPTDTVYGLLVDAGNEEAVNKLIRFKNRPPGKPVSVFVADLSVLGEYVKLDENQARIVTRLIPGPFTIILESKHKTSKSLEAEKGTLGVRIPAYPLINKINKRFSRPITATSANLSGQPPHYQISFLLKKLSQEKQLLINLVVDAGKLPRNKPSTIIDLTSPKIKVIRRGDIVFENETTFISHSSNETKKIACFAVEKILSLKQDKPLAVILEGELGVGKTVFVKGIGEYFNIKDIISPTYVVYYEYDMEKTGYNKLVHFDLYHIEEADEFKHLGIESYLKKGNLLVFEWGEKAGEIYRLLEKKARIIRIRMEYLDENKRKIIVNY
jgi:L-threonylcarbamoyladenylate synthase